MKRAVEVDGVLWPDGAIGVDADGKPWRLTFVQSSWGPAHDAWFWREFGLPVDHVLGSPSVKLPLTRIWPVDFGPGRGVPADTTAVIDAGEEIVKPKRRAS